MQLGKPSKTNNRSRKLFLGKPERLQFFGMQYGHPEKTNSCIQTWSLKQSERFSFFQLIITKSVPHCIHTLSLYAERAV